MKILGMKVYDSGMDITDKERERGENCQFSDDRINF